MKNLWIIAAMCIGLPFIIQSQESFVKGKVQEVRKDEGYDPLAGVNIYWSGTQTGTASDANGEFQLAKIPGNNLLVFSYISFSNDTVDVTGESYVVVRLKGLKELQPVDIVYRRKSTEISFIDPIKIERFTEKELLKAACCNLSESFETSPSVDVSFTDAITGTRQIKMLGLSGKYVQITSENMPDVYGLASIYGLTYIPGTWIEGIQLNKGAGSVVNGSESITGQINVELRKPETADPLYANFFMNEGSRKELNLNLAHIINDKWATAFLMHGYDLSRKNDRNKDGFLDDPLTEHIIALNRWKYVGKNGVRVQLGIKVDYIDLIGGQVAFDPDSESDNIWGMKNNTRRIRAWAKLGKVYENLPWKSIGFQVSGLGHEQDSYFGLNAYNADQNSVYANFIYASILSNTNHKFKSGASFKLDHYNEFYNDFNFERDEIVPGAFFEYTYTRNEQFSFVAGLRGDYHNIFGAYATPRMHLRYQISDNTVLRASGGKGYRTANLFAENIGLFASSRQIIILGDQADLPYGLDQEQAWNFGLNATRRFRLNKREGSLSLDFYRSDFENQIVLDLDQNPQQAIFYNLDGSSFANSFQAQLDYELIPYFDIRMAYRWFDVQIDYLDERRAQPFVAKHRAFVNFAYETKNTWRFDNTINWQGEQRIPSTLSNPEEFRLNKVSPDFITVNAQVTKNWKNKFEVYLGVENLFGFTQKNPILSSNEPFSEYFDSSLIWGPIFGRNIYGGLRYWIR